MNDKNNYNYISIFSRSERSLRRSKRANRFLKDSLDILREPTPPLEEPTVSPYLMELPLLNYLCEVLQYGIKKLEFSMSKSGFMRKWFMFYISLVLKISFPSIIILAALLLIFILASYLVATLTGLLWKLIMLGIPFVIIGIIIFGVRFVFRI